MDEIHEHRTANVVDMLNAGTKGRDQPLILEITNSGTDESTVCRAHHDHSVAVLKATAETDAGFSDSWFAYVSGLDSCGKHHDEGHTQPVEGCADCDDWRSESVWPKANPNLGVSVTARYIRDQIEQAKGLPLKEGKVKRLNVCLWTTAETAWLPAELWARGAGRFDADELALCECHGGLDIASKVDVAAFVLCFPDFPDVGIITYLPHFWIPRATAETRQHTDNVPWLLWEREGYVTITEGDVIDLDAIEAHVIRAHEDYLLHSVRVDPWNAAQISTHLQDAGITVVSFAQNMRNFNEPTKLFQAELKDGKVRHGNHPVLDWMAQNVAVLTDRSGNVRPIKPKPDSPKKVDGLIAAIMARAGAMVAPVGAEGGGCEAW